METTSTYDKTLSAFSKVPSKESSLRNLFAQKQQKVEPIPKVEEIHVLKKTNVHQALFDRIIEGEKKMMIGDLDKDCNEHKYIDSLRNIYFND